MSRRQSHVGLQKATPIHHPNPNQHPYYQQNIQQEGRFYEHNAPSQYGAPVDRSLSNLADAAADEHAHFAHRQYQQQKTSWQENRTPRYQQGPSEPPAHNDQVQTYANPHSTTNGQQQQQHPQHYSYHSHAHHHYPPTDYHQHQHTYQPYRYYHPSTLGTVHPPPRHERADEPVMAEAVAIVERYHQPDSESPSKKTKRNTTPDTTHKNGIVGNEGDNQNDVIQKERGLSEDTVQNIEEQLPHGFEPPATNNYHHDEHEEYSRYNYHYPTQSEREEKSGRGYDSSDNQQQQQFNHTTTNYSSHNQQQHPYHHYWHHQQKRPPSHSYEYQQLPHQQPPHDLPPPLYEHQYPQTGGEQLVEYQAPHSTHVHHERDYSSHSRGHHHYHPNHHSQDAHHAQYEISPAASASREEEEKVQQYEDQAHQYDSSSAPPPPLQTAATPAVKDVSSPSKAVIDMKQYHEPKVQVLPIYKYTTSHRNKSWDEMIALFNNFVSKEGHGDVEKDDPSLMQQQMGDDTNKATQNSTDTEGGVQLNQTALSNEEEDNDIYLTLRSWVREVRWVIRTEGLDQDANPRFPQRIVKGATQKLLLSSNSSSPKATAKEQPKEERCDSENVTVERYQQLLMTPHFPLEINDNVGSSPSVPRSSFQKWLDDLQHYRAKHNGDCNVSLKYVEYPGLGNFVNRQRSEYRKLQQGKKTSMTPSKIRQLDAVSFVWSARFAGGGHTSFQSRLDELRAYKAQTGHTNVPKNYPPNPSLGYWVNEQRFQYRRLQKKKSSYMTEEKVRLLNELDFKVCYCVYLAWVFCCKYGMFDNYSQL